jgi:small subunit ribosomal protein S5
MIKNDKETKNSSSTSTKPVSNSNIGAGAGASSYQGNRENAAAGYNKNKDFNNKFNNYKEKDTTYNTEVLTVNRVSCTTAGGRNMSFRAIVAVGDGKGSLGVGIGKSKEVPDAINKAERQAKKNIIKIFIPNKKLPYDLITNYGPTKIILKRSHNGYVCCNLIKTILTLAGMKHLVAKVYGSTNTNNIIRALMKGLALAEKPGKIAGRRGKNIEDILPTKK